MYLNAFKNTQSTFFRESGGQQRGCGAADGKWGWIDIKHMRVVGGADLTGSLQFLHPDEDNADDQTVVRAALQEPVPPGGTVVLDIAFLAQLPEVYARTGYKGDYSLFGQWFPKLGVYEPSGTRGRISGGRK